MRIAKWISGVTSVVAMFVLGLFVFVEMLEVSRAYFEPIMSLNGVFVIAIFVSTDILLGRITVRKDIGFGVFFTIVSAIWIIVGAGMWAYLAAMRLAGELFFTATMVSMTSAAITSGILLVLALLFWMTERYIAEQPS